MRYSTKWKMWNSVLDTKTCLKCRYKCGKIYDVEEIVNPYPPLHYNCRCKIEKVKILLSGTATKNGENGADRYLKVYGKLPDYYITREAARALGYVPDIGNLADVAPNKMITKGIYRNINGHLPSAPDRVWFEADIDYENGYRGTDRVLFSNDGLIFVTYDHYHTFFEIE